MYYGTLKVSYDLKDPVSIQHWSNKDTLHAVVYV